ncbi:hypothetical protein GCM10023339_07640 [Alloalcanivorax gelatiniphagus]
MMLLALVLTLGTLAFGTLAPASAAPVYEIDGTWVNPPATISRGNPVVAEWRINVNDDQPAPSNDPVDNVTATFSVDNAFFDGIPDLCKTAGVTPASSLNADKTELTCNFGTVDMGTALVLQTPVVANGATGEEIVLGGTSPGDERLELPPILIRNPFQMDMQFAGTSDYNGAWDDVTDPTYVDVPFNWSLRLGNGSDAGPNAVSYRLTLVDVNGRPVVLGTHPTGVGYAKNYGVQGCTEHDLGRADGHPYSGLAGPNRNHTDFVDSCTLTPVAGQPGVFTLTLTGIDYDLADAPTHDSFGNPLPTDWDYVASGHLWFRVLTDQAGSVRLSSNAPTYTAPTGQTSTDLAGNNAATKTYVLPGGFSAAYLRNYTGNGGDRWDDTYRTSAGTTVWTYVANHLSSDSVPANARYGVCQVLDTQYVDFNPTAERPIEYWVSLENQAGRQLDGPPAGAVVEYYTGGVGDPNTFNCGDGTWSTAQPANAAAVTAVRMTYPHSSYSAEDAVGIQFRVPTKIQNNVAIGQDIWTFGSYQRNGTWVSDAAYAAVTPTPGERYPHTNGRRDVLWVVLANPAIRKSSAQNTVTPGVPAEFTLTYSANGTGTVPATVDDYVIRDTLPVGMTYVAGSASPEPAISMSGQQQVLTWTLDDVPTNALNRLLYEAVAGNSIPPGTALTNTAVSSLAGEESAPASKTVTTTANGYTVISKTADTPYIPNVDGSGDGEGVWSVTLRSFDPLPQSFTDTIDVLPYEGDARGTDFEGDYSLVAVQPVAGSTVYYTTADPATLNDDPAHASNGAAPGNPTGNTAGWTTTFTPNATAVRVVGPTLAPGATQQFKVRIATDGADPRDVYVNRAQARTGHTRLEMRTSEPMSMAYFYAATLKKYVQDSQGVWRDAQDLADYPTFRYGDTVRYRIVVTNVGQGTLNNIRVTDDQRPDLGNFVVEELASGESESHEFEFVLDESSNGTVVNTASATTDPPPDSPPPTIPPDPAGFEVANYKTVKSSDPATGSNVKPGDKVTYTVKVSQQGTVPAAASFTDDLSKVLDDASYNGDVKADIGQVEVVNGLLSWNGTVPVGGVATVTYSVTVKPVAQLGDFGLDNVVTSDGCAVVNGATVDCKTTHDVGTFTYSKTSDPATTSAVEMGDTITYTVQVKQKGQGAVPGASLVDDLSRVLDDAAYNGDAKASKGTVSVTGSSLSWNGDLAVGDVVTITYSVKIRAAGDDLLVNKVTSPNTNGVCVPAADGNVDCTTTHAKSDWDVQIDKKAVSGPRATVGDNVRYQLTVSNRGAGTAPGPIKVSDRLPKGLELLSAKGKGWKCAANTKTDNVSCKRTADLKAGEKAPKIIVVAKATKAAAGRLVNVASVSVLGDTVESNNKDKAVVKVKARPAVLPQTGFRPVGNRTVWLGGMAR